jgi:hypothetical protein
MTWNAKGVLMNAVAAEMTAHVSITRASHSRAPTLYKMTLLGTSNTT